MLIFNVLEKDKNKSGIYKITNLTNGKIYIGSASILKKRYLNHKNTLNANTHSNIHLQRAYNKNTNSFIFEILEFCEKECLMEKEQYYLDVLLKASSDYQFFIKNSYNKAIKANNSILSEDTKNKISKILKNNPKVSKKDKDSVRQRAVYVFDINGNYLNTCKSVTETCKQYSIKSTSTVVSICQNKKHSYKDTYVFQYDLKNSLLGEKRTNELNYTFKNFKFVKNKTIIKSSKSKNIYCFDKNNRLIHVFNSLSEIDKFFKKRVSSNISRCIKSKYKNTIQGYYWSLTPEGDLKPEYKHSEETKNKIRIKKIGVKINPIYSSKGKSKPHQFKPVVQYDMQGNFIKEYSSIKEVILSGFKNNSRISEACSGKTKSAYGFLWKYKY